MPVNVEPMQVTQWNLAFERQLPGRMLVDVTYTGSRTSNIWLGYEENPSIYIPGNCVAGHTASLLRVRARTPARSTVKRAHSSHCSIPSMARTYGSVAQTYDQGNGRYNGVRFGLQKRMSNGWSANANYTVSKCISEGEPGTDIGNTFPVPLIDPISNPRPDPSTNEGPCAADRRHNFNLSAVVVSPGFGGGLANVLTRSWQVGVIYQVRSGSALTPSTTGDTALTGLPQRPMIVQGVDPYLAESDRAWVNPRELQWFNMAAFAQNPAGVWGNVPRGYLIGPGFWNVDLALSRNLNLQQGRRIELRIEAFNLFDTVNWANPNVTLASATQGRITNTSGDPRIMQFAVKYNF